MLSGHKTKVSVLVIHLGDAAIVQFCDTVYICKDWGGTVFQFSAHTLCACVSSGAINSIITQCFFVAFILKLSCLVFVFTL
jgi:hypothetical protein